MIWTEKQTRKLHGGDHLRLGGTVCLRGGGPGATPLERGARESQHDGRNKKKKRNTTKKRTKHRLEEDFSHSARISCFRAGLGLRPSASQAGIIRGLRRRRGARVFGLPRVIGAYWAGGGLGIQNMLGVLKAAAIRNCTGRFGALPGGARASGLFSSDSEGPFRQK